MKIRCTPLLRPLFALVANPGLGLPHADHEVELMISGAKPALITGYPLAGEYKKLEPLIEEGKIVHIGSSANMLNKLMYCLPEGYEHSVKAARIFEKKASGLMLSDEEQAFFAEYKQSYVCIANTPKDAQRESSAHSSRMLSELELMRKGKIKASLPFYGLICDDVRDALIKGEIRGIPLSWKIVMGVFAQADHVEDGRELLARSYCNSLGYSDFASREDFDKRFGQLLGYTENDTAFFTCQKYTNRFVRRAMIATMDWRRKVRTELMLYDQQNKAPQVK